MSGAVAIDVAIAGECALDAARIRLLCEAVVRGEQVPGDAIEVGVHFVDERRIAQLNAEHRGVDRPTDVLSFPIDGLDELPTGVPRQLGDVVVCEPYVARQLEQGQQIEPERDGDVAAALARCVVHGMLHLVGHDHELGDEAAARMARREQELLDEVAAA